MIYILGASVTEADRWARGHVNPHDRKPICISSLEQLRGVRLATVVILPRSVEDPMYSYKLVGNTVIDLRGLGV